jgi:maltose-binding protein MalE
LSKRLIPVLAGVVAIAVIAAGCGSSSSSDSTSSGEASGSSLSKTEFIKEADAVCEEGNESLNAEAEEFAKEHNVNIKKPTTAQQEELISKVLGPALREQAKAIHALGAPSGEEAKVKAVVKAVEAAAKETEENPSSLIEGKSGGPFVKADNLARAYGLNVCGSP